MIIKSDWHIHSNNSFDSKLPLEEVAKNAHELGFKKMGITDHVNLNDKKFLGDLEASAKCVKEINKTHPEIILGVELTPIEKPEFDYIKKYGTNEGYIPPVFDKPYEIELAQTKEQLINYGVRYAVGASHCRCDFANARTFKADMDAMIKEWYRQQMWLACDERVTVLGHPWDNGTAIWYEDFSVIPKSMNRDIGAALKENKKYVECNAATLCSPRTSEKFRKQYAEFLRELFEMGIPMTYGSDSHNRYYTDKLIEVEKLLQYAGFVKGDFSDIRDEDFWF